MKRFIIIYVTMVACLCIHAREWRTPLTLQKGTITRLFPETYFELHNFDMPWEDNPTYWLIDFWLAPYWRNAPAYLYTGKEQQKTFPKFSYTDNGFFIGLNAAKYIATSWRFGLRTALPFRSFNMHLKTTTKKYLAKLGLCLSKHLDRGMGDLDTEIFGQCHMNSLLFVESRLGLRLPTAKKVNNVATPLLQPLGNNGHVELALGGRIYFQATDWLQLNIDTLHSWVLQAQEHLAMPHADILNNHVIHCVPANIDWQYLVINIDTIIVANTSNLSLDIGYQLYHKYRDHIIITPITKAALALPLQSSHLGKNSTQTAHIIHAELLYTHCKGAFLFDGFTGLSGVIGGSNVPQDLSWYFGLQVRF